MAINSNELRRQINALLVPTKDAASNDSISHNREAEFSLVTDRLDETALAMALMSNVPEEADHYWAYLVELMNWELRKPKGMRNTLFVHRFSCLMMAYCASNHRSRLVRESVMQLDPVHPAMALWCCYLLGRRGLPWEMLLAHVSMLAEGGYWPTQGATPQQTWNQLMLQDYSFIVWVIAAWILEDDFDPFVKVHYEDGTPLHRRMRKPFNPWRRVNRFAWASIAICAASFGLAWMNLQSLEKKLREAPPTIENPVTPKAEEEPIHPLTPETFQLRLPSPRSESVPS
jgi:hypothetical protein